MGSITRLLTGRSVTRQVTRALFAAFHAFFALLVISSARGELTVRPFCSMSILDKVFYHSTVKLVSIAMSEEKNKDRELQIELAKVQVDAQFYTTAAFSVLAVAIAIVVWLEQLLLLATPSADWKIVLTLVILALIVIAFVVPIILLEEINKVRERIEELKVKISNPSTEESTRKS